MKNVIVIACLAVVGLLIGLSSCYNDKADKVYPAPIDWVSCNTTTITYAKTIAPIFSKTCNMSGCHDGGTPAAIYDFTSYNGIVQAITNDQLIPAIKHQGGLPPMPQTGSLSDCELNQIETWVNNGYPNN